MEQPATDYSQYYSIGMRVGIDIPLKSGELFREWGIITDMDGDFIQLRLSRDVLPEEMKIEVGTIFLVVTGKEGAGLCCRGIVVAESDRRVVPLRLISEVLLYERRDFFRLGCYLPMAWQPCIGMTGREMRERWEDIRLFRLWNWSELNESVPMMKPLTQDQRSRYEEMRESLRVAFKPQAVNISGGGLRLKTGQELKVGDRVALQFFIPFAKPNTLEIVAEVVWTAPVRTSAGVEPLYYVAMSYYFIDERDRESVIRFISLEQLQQLQDLRSKAGAPVAQERALSVSEPPPQKFRKLAVASLLVLLLAAIAALLVPKLVDYYSRGSERNQIEQTFEQGVKKYRKGSGSNELW
jgi:hypothetical protein